jgi:Phytanoyl-CoA dioxygenase (PhyH)
MVGIQLKSGQLALETTSDKFGFLRNSSDLATNPAKALERLEADGYIYVPGFHNLEVVQSARKELLHCLAKEGALDPQYPIEDGISKPDLTMYFRPDIANKSKAIQDLVYSEYTMNWFSQMLGEPALHYDFTWLHVIAKGQGTWPHCDIVYMGRGTRQLYTMWTPLGNVPLNVGGLIVLENSHRQTELHQSYGQLDIDTVCVSAPDKNEVEAHGFHESGAITINPVKLRDDLGGRWLTAEEYRMGDALIFGMDTVHASLDNQTDFVRLSTDTRYQRASDPVDERWVGEALGHHTEKKEAIC